MSDLEKEIQKKNNMGRKGIGSFFKRVMNKVIGRRPVKKQVLPPFSPTPPLASPKANLALAHLTVLKIVTHHQQHFVIRVPENWVQIEEKEISVGSPYIRGHMDKEFCVQLQTGIPMPIEKAGIFHVENGRERQVRNIGDPRSFAFFITTYFENRGKIPFKGIMQAPDRQSPSPHKGPSNGKTH
jgi:hypothetical protein